MPEIDLNRLTKFCFNITVNDPLREEYGCGALKSEGKIQHISLSCEDVVRRFTVEDKPLLNKIFNKDCWAISYDIPYQLEWLNTLDIYPNKCSFWDIFLAESLLDGGKSDICLEYLAKQYLSNGQTYYLKYITLEDLNTIAVKQAESIGRKGLLDAYHTEMQVSLVLLEMRKKGVRIDIEAAERLRDTMLKDEKELHKVLCSECGFQLNIWRTKSLQTAFDKLSLPYKLTDKGNPSFSQSSLSSLANSSKFVERLLTLREIDRIRTAFVENTCLNMHYNGRIHCTFHTTKVGGYGAKTGRISSSRPSLQKIPSLRKLYGKEIRSLFIPEKGAKWVSLDYNQQEPRIMCHFADLKGFDGVKDIVNAYSKDVKTDFYDYIANKAKISRTQAKTISLGLLYGMGKDHLASELNTSLEKANELFEAYHEAMPFIKQLTHDTATEVSEKGYIKTLRGRHIYFNMVQPISAPYGSNGVHISEAKETFGDQPLKRTNIYRAINSLIQGSAADMMKKALIDIDKAGYTPHLTIHDELGLSLSSNKEYKECIDIMQNGMELSVPIWVDGSKGINWGEACSSRK